MKVNKSYILLIGLALLVVFAFMVKQRNSSLSDKDRLKTFEFSNKIDRFEVISPQQQVALSYSNGTWLIDDQTEADNKQVQQLFQSLELLTIQSAVSSNQKDHILQQINKSGRTINVYSDKKQVYSITVGQHKQKDFALTPSGKLYYISIKGNASASVYNLLQANATSWQDRILINLKAEEITSIKLDYPNNLTHSFFIDNKEQPILYNSDKKEMTDLNQETLNDYPYFFNGIAYALIDTSLQKPDINKHLFSLRIHTNISKIIAIEGFELVNITTHQRNNNTFAGIVNNSILVQLKYSDFDPIVVDIDYFLKK